MADKVLMEQDGVSMMVPRRKIDDYKREGWRLANGVSKVTAATEGGEPEKAKKGQK